MFILDNTCLEEQNVIKDKTEFHKSTKTGKVIKFKKKTKLQRFLDSEIFAFICFIGAVLTVIFLSIILA